MFVSAYVNMLHLVVSMWSLVCFILICTVVINLLHKVVTVHHGKRAVVCTYYEIVKYDHETIVSFVRHCVFACCLCSIFGSCWHSMQVRLCCNWYFVDSV